ncbi:MAG: hypothetical protein R3E13_09275 [Alphaproteobacteria bacterium]
MKKTNRKMESGNVLFLILIAVALFAALSYAVTQSSRSGGGASDGEANLVNSAQITQYPASVRTAIVRMIIGGTDVTGLNFDPPSAFDEAPPGTSCDNLSASCVFHPNGGGATYVSAPATVTASGVQVPWIFTSEYAIEDIGTSANDIIAMFPGISSSVCTRLNQEFGVTNLNDGDSDGVSVGATTLPTSASNMSRTEGNVNIDNPAAAPGTLIDGDFAGQPFGCYDQNDASAGGATMVYYHVLVER